MRLLKKYKSFLFSRFTKNIWQVIFSLQRTVPASQSATCTSVWIYHIRKRHLNCLTLFFHILQHFSLKIISSLMLKLLLKNTSKQFLTGIWPECSGYKRKIFHFFLQYLQSSRTTLSLHPLPCSETFPATPYSLNPCYYSLTSTDQFSLKNKLLFLNRYPNFWHF